MSKLPSTDSSLVRYLGRQKRSALRQAQSSPYVRSGITLISEGIASVDGQIQSHDFDGTGRTHLGSAGWMLGWADGLPSMLVLNGVDVYADLAAKTATLATTVANLGTAMTNITALIADTVRGGQNGTWTTNFAVPTGTGTSVASRTIAVPAGFTHALVFAIAHASAKNTTASNEYLYVGAAINSVTPAMLLAPVLPNGYAVSSGSATRILSGLSGGVITIDAMVHSEFASWTATGSNLASIDAIALFYR